MSLESKVKTCELNIHSLFNEELSVLKPIDELYFMILTPWNNEKRGYFVTIKSGHMIYSYNSEFEERMGSVPIFPSMSDPLASLHS